MDGLRDMKRHKKKKKARITKEKERKRQSRSKRDENIEESMVELRVRLGGADNSEG